MNFDDGTGHTGQYGEDIGRQDIEPAANVNSQASPEKTLLMGMSDGLAKAQKAYDKVTKTEHMLENDGDNIQAEMDLGYATKDLANALQDVSDQAIQFKQRIEPEVRETPESQESVNAWADRMKQLDNNADLQL